MSASHNNSDHFSIIYMGNHNDNEKGLLTSQNEEMDIDLKTELNKIESEYLKFLTSLEEFDADLTEVSNNFDNQKLKKIDEELNFLKGRIKLINEDLQILNDIGTEKGINQEMKSLFKNTKNVYQQVQRKYSEVAFKTKEVFKKLSEEEYFQEDEKEGEYYEQLEKERQIEKLFLKMDNKSENSSNLNGLHRISIDIKKLATEIQKDINEQGNDLLKLEQLIEHDENNHQENRKNKAILQLKEDMQEEHQNRTNTYLIAWCIGSFVLLTIMIVLKFVVNKSNSS